MSAGGIPPYIYADIGGVDRWIWFVLAYLIALAGICPFVGSLSDLLGRRYVALIGSLLIIIGVIVSSTSHHMNIFIGKFGIEFPSLVRSPVKVTHNALPNRCFSTTSATPRARHFPPFRT